MRYSDSFFHSKVYQEFKEIGLHEYRSIVQFYEDSENDIKQLDFDEYFELFLAYGDALFEMGAYQNHLEIADQAIETTIEHNIKFYQGQDVYFELLFKKAASHYNLLEYKKAEHILKELIKMDTTNQVTIRFLKKCVRQDKPSFLKKTRAFSVLCFLLTALVISIELIVVRPLFEEHATTIEMLRNFIFVLGWFILLTGDLFHRFKVNQKINAFVKQINQEKENNKKEDCRMLV